MKKPINPKRVALVRDFRMLNEEDWPDDMCLEKLWHFAILTGFEIDFFRQDDPPDFNGGHMCSNIGELTDEEWAEILKDG